MQFYVLIIIGRIKPPKVELMWKCDHGQLQTWWIKIIKKLKLSDFATKTNKKRMQKELCLCMCESEEQLIAGFK